MLELATLWYLRELWQNHQNNKQLKVLTTWICATQLETVHLRGSVAWGIFFQVPKIILSGDPLYVQVRLKSNNQRRIDIFITEILGLGKSLSVYLVYNLQLWAQLGCSKSCVTTLSSTDCRKRQKKLLYSINMQILSESISR